MQLLKQLFGIHSAAIEAPPQLRLEQHRVIPGLRLQTGLVHSAGPLRLRSLLKQLRRQKSIARLEVRPRRQSRSTRSLLRRPKPVLARNSHSRLDPMHPIIPLLGQALALHLIQNRLCQSGIPLPGKQLHALELGFDLLVGVRTQTRHNTECLRGRSVQTHQELGATHQQISIKNRRISLLALEHHAVPANGLVGLLYRALRLLVGRAVQGGSRPIVQQNKLRKIVFMGLTQLLNSLIVCHLTIIKRIKSRREFVVLFVEPSVSVAAATPKGNRGDQAKSKKAY